jgi:hypothetical protein
MLEEQVSIKVGQEIKNKTWGVTEQFLQVHDIVLVNGQPKIERIDTDKVDGTIITYLPVREELFYFAVYFDNKETLNITWIGTEPYNSVYFRATSDNLTFDELTSLTNIKPTRGWDKGQKRKSGTGTYNFSSIDIEPNPEPDEFEDKIKKLLDLLEQDKEGMKKLGDSAGGQIQVAMKFHNGNTMLGGPHLDKGIISRLSNLNLSVDFDLYADGKFFRA